MNTRALATLSASLIGPVPDPGRAVVKGSMLGTLAFLIFEFASKFNENIPRVPVAWLLMVATLAIETVLLFRLVSFVRFPRKPDFMFVARLGYAQRITVALHASKRAHAAFIPFTGAALAVAAVLEAAAMDERSPMVLAALPCVTLLFMAGTGLFCRFAISRRWVGVTHRDDTKGIHAVGEVPFFRALLARKSIVVARCLSGWMPSRSIRMLLMRNLLYLLRGEIILTLLLLIAVPVLLFFLMLLIGDPWSPFVSLLPLVAAFMMQLHFIGEIGEAAVALPACYWIAVRYRSILVSNLLSLMLPLAVVLPVYYLVTASTLVTPAGAVRGGNELLFFMVTAAIGAFRVSSGKRRDQDGVTDFLLFAGIAVGNFIPWSGSVFAVAVAGVLLLLNREMVRS
ncbi:MAG: hypothetical protein JW863_17170 [Chitinispirillaceae bacterium]|nr:hypothetical protein [Chitinispirillaceae bacterium]